jgi:CheY-like chemotaxis protein
MPRPRVIWLVDDDRDFLEMERTILAARGYLVTCFAEPKAALAALRAGGPGEAPGLVVTDLMMDRLDAGFSFARALRAEPGMSDVPIIIVSAVSRQRGFDFRPRTAEDLTTMGVDAWLDKPISPDALLAKIEELLP